MKHLKLISLNIERSKHLEKVILFLKKERPDIVCLQEVIQNDVSRLTKELGMHASFTPMAKLASDDNPSRIVTEGICILSPHILHKTKRRYYYRLSKSTPRYIKHRDRTLNRVLLYTTIIKDRTAFTIGTTHFSWTPHGNTSAKQRVDIKELLKIIATIPEIIFCGDFNAPRGGEIFQTLAQHFVDHIPKKYHQSLDLKMHRNKHLRLMVDGLFSTRDYLSNTVTLVHGVSDHVAIRAYISHNKKIL